MPSQSKCVHVGTCGVWGVLQVLGPCLSAARAALVSGLRRAGTFGCESPPVLSWWLRWVCDLLSPSRELAVGDPAPRDALEEAGAVSSQRGAGDTAARPGGHSGCCHPPAPAPDPLNERFPQHFVTVLACANLVPLPVAFPSELPAGCFIFNTCSAPELSHRLLRSLVTTPVVLFLPGAEKCQHSTENFNIPTVQLYLLKSSLHH